MNLKRLLATGAVIAAATLPAIPAASAAYDTAHCGVAVVDDTHGSFDHAAVEKAVQGILQDNPDLEVYVRGVAPLAGDYTPAVYDQEFRQSCSPATDYVLVALDGNGYAGLFYGRHFDRLVPVLNTHAGQFLTDFYGSEDTDKTAAVVSVLSNFRTTLAENPGYADYVTHPTSYLAIGPVPAGDGPPGMFTSELRGLLVLMGCGLVLIVVGIVALVRDKKDHRWD